MASLLKLALEAELGTLYGSAAQPNAQEGQQGGEKELMVLKGPLAEQFSQALSQIYDKTKTPSEEESETAVEGVAIESQANDALTLQDFADSVQLLGEDGDATEATTVYGVDAADVKPEDVVEVSQDIDEFDPEDPDFVLVMNGMGASDNGEDSGESAVPQVNEYAKALEAMCLRKGVQMYPSLEAFAEKRKAEKVVEKELHFKAGKGKLTNGHEATDEGLGLEYCDPEVLGVVMKLTHDKIDVNLGEDTQFFPAGSKINALHEEKVKEFVKEVELHFKGKIDPKAGVHIKTPKEVAKYFSKGKINGKNVKTV